MRLCECANECMAYLGVEDYEEERRNGDAAVEDASIALVVETRLVAWDCDEVLGRPLYV